MFLELEHQKLDVFKIAKALVKECHLTTKSFPPEERFVMTPQMRRAALSVCLNIAEGCSRKSVAERKRFFEIARGSVVEIETGFEIACEMGHCTQEQITSLGSYLVRCFSMLSRLMKDPFCYQTINRANKGKAKPFERPSDSRFTIDD